MKQGRGGVAPAREQTLIMQPPRQRTSWFGHAWDQILTFVDQVFGPSSRGVRNVVRGKLRLALVAGIVGVSLMFVAVMVALNAGVQQRLAAAQDQIGTAITITPAGNGGFGGGGSSASGENITATQVHTIANTAGVASYSEYVTTRDADGIIKGTVAVPTNIPTFGGNAFAGAVDGTIAPRVQGLLPGQSPLALANGVTLKLTSGRAFAAADATADVALTSQALAKANGYAVGSTFTLNGTTVKLVGQFTSGDSFNDDTIIVPFQTAQKIYGIAGATGVTAYADSVSDVNTVANNLRSALGPNFDVVAQAQIYTSTIDALHATQSTIATTLVIAAFVAALVIVFAIVLIVRERTQEIGVLRAIGASQRQIVQQFAAESIALGAVAAAMATVLIALFAGTIANQFSTANVGGTGGRIFIRVGGAFGPGGGGLAGAASQVLSAGLTPGIVLLVFALGIGLAILASVIPAWYVSRVRPAEALRTVG